MIVFVCMQFRISQSKLFIYLIAKKRRILIQEWKKPIKMLRDREKNSIRSKRYIFSSNLSLLLLLLKTSCCLFHYWCCCCCCSFLFIEKSFSSYYYYRTKDIVLIERIQQQTKKKIPNFSFFTLTFKSFKFPKRNIIPRRNKKNVDVKKDEIH